MLKFRIIPFILLLSVGCSDAKLFKRESTGLASSGKLESQLPAPKMINGNLRIVLFVDHSFSMIRQKCPTELDGDSTNVTAISNGDLTGCQPTIGADPEGDRFKVISTWLDQAEQFAQQNPSLTVKIALIPFSGGKYQRPSVQEMSSGNFAFLSDFTQLRTWLAALVKEQQDELDGLGIKAPSFKVDLSKIDYEAQHMGTTIPLPTLTFTQSLIEKEMVNLRDADQLQSSRFQFVYMSDGALKTTQDIWDKARHVIGCPTDVECKDPAYAGYDGCSANGRTICDDLFQGQYRRTFGDFEPNTLQKVADEMNAITALPRKYGGGSLNLVLAKIKPQRTPKDDAVSPNPNLFDLIYSQVKGARRAVIQDGNAPFDIMQVGGGYSFRLDRFYAVNLNAFTDATGTIRVDSDGDGLSDIMEAQNKTDPALPRTNGFCYDGLANSYGCRTMGCDNTLDPNLTGLNECESKTLQTKRDTIDTDFDGLADLYEILRGLNPLRNEAQDFTAGDSHTDHEHFFAGLLPSTPWNMIPDQNKISMIIDFGGYKAVQGSTDFSASYSIQIKNIPLVATQATKVFSPLLMSSSGAKVPDNLSLAPLPHPAGVNELVFLARVVANESPNFYYWLIKRLNVPTNGSQSSYNLEINFADFSQLEGKQ